MTKFEEYLDALSEAIEYDIEPAEMGSHVIIVDEDIRIQFREDDFGTQITLFCIVAPSLPKGISYQDAEDLVDMGGGPFYGAPGLGRLPVVGAMVLYHILPYTRTDREKFVESVNEFIDLSREYFDKFAEMGDEEEDEEDEDVDFDEDGDE